MTSSGLTDKEFDIFNDIVGDVIESLIIFADNNNIDRDSLMKYFATMFSAMCEVATFENYGLE